MGSGVLAGIAAAMAPAPPITHLGQLQFLSSAAWQDLLPHYPMALVIAGRGFFGVRARSQSRGVTQQKSGEPCHAASTSAAFADYRLIWHNRIALSLDRPRCSQKFYVADE